MNIKDFYTIIDSNYDNILKRMGNDERIKKFILLFLYDDSYNNFINAINNNKEDEAFRAIHTLKGVCLNLEFAKLYKISNEITELLRNHNVEEAKNLIDELKVVYQRHISAIENLKEN